MKWFLCAWVAGILAAFAGDEVILHTGPEFTTPGLESLNGLGKDPDITFVREFAVDLGKLGKFNKLDESGRPGTLSAEEAIAAARADVAGEYGNKVAEVVRIEVLNNEPSGTRPPELRKAPAFHLIELSVDGTTAHRIVLADGTVVRSRLRRITKR
ncbi:hypothetical protein [Luteolibacter marinus]|uniref:hypothetical protein n=1 Tax=Luteolibacter marinus TaxID=2776705 RepID=UPI00186669BA|nr:hypothetical protein [Luteolibacter marinus]